MFVKQSSFIQIGFFLFTVWIFGTWYLNSYPAANSYYVRFCFCVRMFFNKCYFVEIILKYVQSIIDNSRLRTVVPSKLINEIRLFHGREEDPPSLELPNEPIAVLVIACKRAKAIKNHLDQLLKYVTIKF